MPGPVVAIAPVIWSRAWPLSTGATGTAWGACCSIFSTPVSFGSLVHAREHPPHMIGEAGAPAVLADAHTQHLEFRQTLAVAQHALPEIGRGAAELCHSGLDRQQVVPPGGLQVLDSPAPHHREQ